MNDLTGNAPRRYFVDAVGRRVLVGLTQEETSEFELLDGEQAVDGVTGQSASGEGDRSWGAGRLRWVELYEKHEEAWKAWMAQSRAERPLGFSLY
jgi:hypothetical protein